MALGTCLHTCGPVRTVLPMDMYEDALNYGPIVDRLLNAQGPPGECWLWDGPVRGGVPVAFRKIAGKSVALRVRILVLLQQGPRPAGCVTRDTCGQPLCVNPEHVVWVHRREVLRVKVGTTQCPAGHPKLPGERCAACNRLGSAERREWIKVAAATLGMTGLAYRAKYGEGKYRAMGFCE